MREKLRQFIGEAVRSEWASARAGDALDFDVIPAADPAHGDYATNAALALAKAERGNPRAMAERLAERLRSAGGAWISSAVAAGPGFVNITLADSLLFEMVRAAARDPERWGMRERGAAETVIVEYFQLNIAKRPHVGHLRSAVIGDALKRMFVHSGYRAISDTHVGDWGTQFGILLHGWKAAHGTEPGARLSGDPFVVLEDTYRKENDAIEAEPSRRDSAKEEFAQLERGDPVNRRLWEWMVDISMAKLEASADRLGLVPFDEHRGESSYEAAMPPIVERALASGVAQRMPDGAVTVDLSGEGLGEAVLVKGDGASTYLLRDLATIEYRRQRWNPVLNLYVVDVRQSHHFRQLFSVAERMGLGAGASRHVSFGALTLPEGPMSTRRGTAISLDAVLDEAEARARAVIREKNPGLADADRIARQIGIGALKYFDLSHHRSSDLVFDWDRALSFDGNTGPYIQYTHARLRSILRKLGGGHAPPAAIGLDPVEHRLSAALARFPEALDDALETLSPSVLARYLYECSQLANAFYHSHPVSQEGDDQKRAVRALIVEGAAGTLRQGLWLLGIAAPDEM